jgi:2-polyprenyl-3-methyl-5-hydroxy-6-metoxy-1,4-benzoquinol methylase
MVSTLSQELDEQIRDNSQREYAYDFDFKMHEYLFAKFQRYGLSGEALELGAHKGDFTAKLAPCFSSVVAVEGAPDVAQKLSDRFNGGNVETFASRFEELSLDRKFDAVFLMHTLEHIDQPVALLKRIYQWLKPEGKLFLACPNANAASRQIAVMMGLISHNAAVTEGEAIHGHYKTYSLDTLELEARSAGFEVVDRGGVFFKPLANFQIDRALEMGIIDTQFLDGCFALGDKYPDLCSSIFLVCTR